MYNVKSGKIEEKLEMLKIVLQKICNLIVLWIV